MLLNPENGQYMFEVVLGFQLENETEFTLPYLVQADDLDEAEEKVMEILEEQGVDKDFWIEEWSDPYALEEYQQMLDDNGSEAYVMLDDLTEEDFQEILGQ